MFGIFKRGKKEDKGRKVKRVRFEYLPLRDDIPEPKGKFRNLFAERGMMPESMKANPDAQPKPNAPKSE